MLASKAHGFMVAFLTAFGLSVRGSRLKPRFLEHRCVLPDQFLSYTLELKRSRKEDKYETFENMLLSSYPSGKLK